MGCVPLLHSLGDLRVAAVAAFWISLGTLSCYCLLAEKGPVKRQVQVTRASHTALHTL